MKPHTKLLFSLALAMLACALVPSCASAPKSVTQFVEMSDEEFAHWTKGVALYSEKFSDVVLDTDPKAREDLEKLCAVIDGTSLVPHEETWATSIVPILLFEIESMLREHGGIMAGTERMFTVFMAVRDGVRKSLDRKEVGP